jgi:hypothetical protein
MSGARVLKLPVLSQDEHRQIFTSPPTVPLVRLDLQRLLVTSSDLSSDMGADRKSTTHTDTMTTWVLSSDESFGNYLFHFFLYIMLGMLS